MGFMESFIPSHEKNSRAWGVREANKEGEPRLEYLNSIASITITF